MSLEAIVGDFKRKERDMEGNEKMTAKEAFAIAFDAAPRLPSTKSTLPSLGKDTSSKPEQTIAQHMAQYHPHGFNPRDPNQHCKLFDRMVGQLKDAGMDEESATKQALAIHNELGSGRENAINPNREKPRITYKADSESARQTVNQVLMDVTSTYKGFRIPYDQPVTRHTTVGDIVVMNPYEDGVLRYLMAMGALDELEEIKETQEEGSAVENSEQPDAGEVNEEASEEEADNGLRNMSSRELTQKLENIISYFTNLSESDQNSEIGQKILAEGKAIREQLQRTLEAEKTAKESKRGWFSNLISSIASSLRGGGNKTDISRGAPNAEYTQPIERDISEYEHDGTTARNEEKAKSVQSLLENINTAMSQEEREYLKKRMAYALEGLHAEGGVVSANTFIDTEGNVSTIEDSSDAPDSNVLLNPTAEERTTSKVNDLDGAKAKLNKILSENGFGERENMKHQTTLNQTKILIPVDGLETGRGVEKKIKDLAPTLQRKNVDVFYNAATGNVEVSFDNDVQGMVQFKDIMNSPEWQEAKAKMHAPMALGKDENGKPIIVDLAEMPHLLIGGVTGYGKSFMMKSIINSFLMGKSPQEVRMVLIDPKGVEFSPYANSKHNLCPIAHSGEEITRVLNWLQQEMENRNMLFNAVSQQTGKQISKLSEYNEWAKANNYETLPVIPTIIDECSSMLDQNKTNRAEIETLLKDLAQKGRSAGIHLVVATQNPKKENIGDLRDNMPAQIGFHTILPEQAKAILGHGGGVDKNGKRILDTGDLQRKGEFIFELNNKQVRGQGAMPGDNSSRLVDYWNGKEVPIDETNTEPEVQEEPQSETPPQEKARQEQQEQSTDTSESPKPIRKAKDVDSKQVRMNNYESLKDYIKRLEAGKNEALDAIEGFDTDALDRINEDFDTQIEKVKSVMEQRFPDKLAEEARLQEESQEVPAEEEHEDDMSPKAWLEREKKDLDDKIRGLKQSRTLGKINEDEMRKQISAAQNRYDTIKKGVEGGLDYDTITDRMTRIQHAEDTKNSQEQSLAKQLNKGEITQEAYDKKVADINAIHKKYVDRVSAGKTNEQIKQEDREEAQRQEKHDKELRETLNKDRAGAVPTAQRKGVKTVLVPSKMAKQILAKQGKEGGIPDGWQMDTDAMGQPIAMPQPGNQADVGWIYVRHPTNGSYGSIAPNGKFNMLVNTTDPRYKGEMSEEGKRAKARLSKLKKQKGVDEETIARAEKEMRNICFGMDQAPDSFNKALVSLAIENALHEVGTVQTEG